MFCEVLYHISTHILHRTLQMRLQMVPNLLEDEFTVRASCFLEQFDEGDLMRYILCYCFLTGFKVILEKRC